MWRKSGSQEKEGEQKRVVPLGQTHTKEIQVFRVLKFRVFGGLFWFRSRERERERDLLFFVECPSSSHRKHHHQRRRLLGCLSIFARRTHDALFFARYYIVSPLSLSSSSSSSLAFLGATTTPTKGAILRLFLCCVIVCGVENSKRERERETYRKERHTHA